MMKISCATVPALFALSLLVSCTKPEVEKNVTASLRVSPSTIEMERSAGTAQLNVTTNVVWTVSSDAGWLKLSPAGGSASTSAQAVTISAEQNDGDTREAVITVTALTTTAIVRVTQKSADDDGLSTVTIGELRRKSPGTDEWYKVKATVASIADYTYGNLYIVDDTGYIYVYGLTKEKQSANDRSFSSLGLKAGDEVTLVGKLTKYDDILELGGTVPAYCRKHIPGTYNGTKSSCTTAGWMELPATDASDGYDIVTHYMYSEGLSGNRSYTYSWNADNMVANWVAYPLCTSFRGEGERTESYGFDPMIDPDRQPYLGRTYKIGNGGAYSRGHQLPSADRLGRRENIEVFFGTNITPQYASSNEFSGKLEALVRGDWRNGCDTLYIVTGCDLKGSTLYVYDQSAEQKKVTVPVGYYKAVLRYSAKSGYAGIAVYFLNDASYEDFNSSDGDIKAYIREKSLYMSVDDLEEKLGMDLFANLPKTVGEDKAKEIEAEDPKDNDCWW